VSADIAMLRYGLKPNEPRPLEEIKRPFWRAFDAK
jgi:hypothetical protein